MSRCEEYEVLISSYVDDELDARDRERVEEHVERCPACREYLEDMRRTTELLFAAAEAEPDPDLDYEAIWDGIEENLAPDPTWFERVREWIRGHRLMAPALAAGLAAAALVLVLKLTAWTPQAPVALMHTQRPGVLEAHETSTVESTSMAEGVTCFMTTTNSGNAPIFFINSQSKG